MLRNEFLCNSVVNLSHTVVILLLVHLAILSSRHPTALLSRGCAFLLYCFKDFLLSRASRLETTNCDLFTVKSQIIDNPEYKTTLKEKKKFLRKKEEAH